MALFKASMTFILLLSFVIFENKLFFLAQKYNILIFILFIKCYWLKCKIVIYIFIDKDTEIIIEIEYASFMFLDTNISKTI